MYGLIYFSYVYTCIVTPSSRHRLFLFHESFSFSSYCFPQKELIFGFLISWVSFICSWISDIWYQRVYFLCVCLWRRKWQPTPVFLPGESQGPGSPVDPSVGLHRVGHDWSDLAAAAAAAACLGECTFCVKSKKLLPKSSLQLCFSMFSSKSFIILALTI